MRDSSTARFSSDISRPAFLRRPQATFTFKADTDANYKRMLHEGLEDANIAAVRLGIASHNLFDLSYAIVLSHRKGHLDKVQLEMLEGMANHQRRALCELVTNMLLYAPATRKEDFVNAIGYLIRRLDENTGPENFLRHAFRLEVGSDAWRLLEQGFRRASPGSPTCRRRRAGPRTGGARSAIARPVRTRSRASSTSPTPTSR